jgi:SAM-dependent methyltransferase
MSNEQSELIASSKAVYGIDLDWTGLVAHPAINNKVFGDLTRLPFQDDSFDVVSANMVAEHLAQPEKVLREVQRVLRPSGRFIFHTPNYLAWTVQTASRTPEWLKKPLILMLEGRRAQDVFRTFYKINTEGEIRQAAREAELNTEEITMVSSSAATAMLGPIAIAELLYIRRLQHPDRAKYRSNIVATLRKVA